MNPRTLLLAAGVLALQSPDARPVRPLPEPAPAPRGSETVYPGRRRGLEESNRRLEAARLKRSRRRARRLELAAVAREAAIVSVALSPTLTPLRDERYPEALRWDLAEQIVEDLPKEQPGRWTVDRIRHSPTAAIRAWGTR